MRVVTVIFSIVNFLLGYSGERYNDVDDGKCDGEEYFGGGDYDAGGEEIVAFWFSFGGFFEL